MYKSNFTWLCNPVIKRAGDQSLCKYWLNFWPGKLIKIMVLISSFLTMMSMHPMWIWIKLSYILGKALNWVFKSKIAWISPPLLGFANQSSKEQGINLFKNTILTFDLLSRAKCSHLAVLSWLCCWCFLCWYVILRYLLRTALCFHSKNLSSFRYFLKWIRSLAHMNIWMTIKMFLN